MLVDVSAALGNASIVVEVNILIMIRALAKVESSCCLVHKKTPMVRISIKEKTSETQIL